MSVLVVEDEPSIRYLLQLLLESNGFVPRLAQSAEEGLEQFDREVELVICDLGLPGRDGYWLIERLRALSSIPIIVVTAHGEFRDEVTARALGANDFLTKPFSRVQLLGAVNAQLASAGT